jgi:hypothetical protein
MNRVLIESDSVSLKIHGDSSIYYYDKVILISPNGKLGQKYLADVYANLGVYNFYEENYEIAEKYCFKSLNIYQINKDTIKMMEGDLKVVSSKKEGTQIFIHVPIPIDG